MCQYSEECFRFEWGGGGGGAEKCKLINEDVGIL